MSVNDFVILPGSKTGVSVKLKAKSIRELQLEKVQLELENKEMEKTLQQLQSNMSREKQERERASGYRWKSGQAGLGMQPQLLLQNKENVGKVSSGKIKLRILKEQIPAPEPAKQPLASKVAKDAAPEKPKVKGKACGQCETKTALLVCLECGEDYCPSCFARVHQKGALKLHRTTSLQAKARIPVRKLEAAQQFLRTINPEESNGCINNRLNKEVNDILVNTSDIPSPLPKMPAYNIEEASTEPSAEDRPESQSGGSLLHGVFDEEESAKSFQEALNQWRSRNHSPKSKEERSCQVGPENTGSCQVQTSPPVAKKAIEIEFKEDGLKYMERLLIKKHRRTPVDKLPDSIITDELKLEKPQINEPDDTWVGGEDDDEDDDDIAFARFEAKEMKKYWADVSKGEEPEALLANVEPSLEIRVLEDACKEEPEEPANFVVSEAGSDDLIDYSGPTSENQKTEPDVFLAQAGNITTRSSLSPAAQKEQCVNVLHNKQKETPRARAPFAESRKADGAWGCSGAEETVPCTPFKGAAANEKHSKTRKISTHKKSEQASRPPKSAPREPCAVMSAESHEASPLTAKSSVLLQEIAQKEKPSCAPYRGLEEFFTSCEQVMMESFPSPRAGRQSPSRGISFSGSQQWMRQFSLSECADESVVQDVLERELGRPSSRLGRQSPGPRAYRSKLSIENAFARPLSANIPFCRTITPTLRPSSVLQTGSESSATWPLSRAASEISEIEGIDVTEHDDPFLEYSTDQQALADLEDEWQSNADPWEEFSDLSSGDFSRHSKGACQNLPDFLNSHEIKDYSKGDAIRVYDESHTDDEEDQRDKQQVIELQ
ncbi:zinc finger B-box domain-containing protein 1 isoform X1 [Podarcis raffonei]|uniref:zinc finger B-box domain-containing protein 1 isoform X1 n=1 Tax=Podarcis raffonei TaxID=65483 RepID=UPI0023298E7B|nr:zinc finger B-box domain-containing protein 1 isoform X1 [Podarcis raffonei]XP_053246419.1 zinc finger B-box domain-containing protein 1 isoform X1 [Podarcis raffonei]XP_053246420.1 zinc finger B-box domain-containing protein 1 isoform X1 [Podarcis raffonei]XP_053246421.1 zinc finger B-box domain-containing protein 1 isoform X1 [Podarcis raffonei]